MAELKKVGFRLAEIAVIWSIGYLFTLFILKPGYETAGIPFTGDLWINCFGVAYIFFVLYSLIFGLLVFKESVLFKQRLASILFWVIFVAANYAVFIPFIKGENPF